MKNNDVPECMPCNYFYSLEHGIDDFINVDERCIQSTL